MNSGCQQLGCGLWRRCLRIGISLEVCMVFEDKFSDNGHKLEKIRSVV